MFRSNMVDALVKSFFADVSSANDAIARVIWWHANERTCTFTACKDASQPVLVVGTGPSGLSAAWMLTKSGRKAQAQQRFACTTGMCGITYAVCSIYRMCVGFVVHDLPINVCVDRWSC